MTGGKLSKSNSEFLEELYIKNSYYRRGEFEVISEYKNSKVKILLKNKFGIMSMLPWILLTNNKPSISNALNKTEYYKNYLYEYNSFYREGFFKIVGKFEKMSSKIQVETKYGLCEAKAQSFIKHVPSIETAINKTEYFINQSNEVHKFKYNYSETEYKYSNIEVKIGCPYHGTFKQKPSSHKSGQGCPRCKTENCFRKSDWIKGDKKGTLYLIYLEDENEKFYKIGITKNSLTKRYSGSNKFLYRYDIINLIILDNKELIWDCEKKIKRLLVNYKYLPHKEFAGSKTECFILDKKVQEIFKQLKEELK